MAGRLRRRATREIELLLSLPGRLGRTVESVRSIIAETRARRREPRLTIAVDVSPLWESLTGVGWYLHRLLDALGDRDDLRLRLYGPTTVWTEDLPQPAAPLPSGAAVELVRRPVPDRLLVPRGTVVRLLRLLEPLLLALDGNRVLFAPNYFLPRRFRLCRGDLVAMIHDLGSVRVPWTLHEETLRELRQNLAATAFEARLLLTPSEAVRLEVVAAGLAPAARVRAIHHGPGQLSARSAAGGSGGPAPPWLTEHPGPFVLFVGTLEPRKDFATLLSAWQLLEGRLPEARLVVCGRLGWKSGGIADALRQVAGRGRVVHRGYVETAELSSLYQRATVVAFPTLYEGFGLPALEAMASGTPLLCSDLPVLREVAAEAAIFAPPGDPAAWALSLERLLNDGELRRDLAAAGRRRAAAFRWERTAAETAEAFFAAGG